MDTLRSTLVGAVSVTSLLVALFFLRFWYSTRDLRRCFKWVNFLERRRQ